MSNASCVKTPLDLKNTLKPNSVSQQGDQSNVFTCLIGSLQYLSTATHPNITYAINHLSTYTANPSIAHYTAVKPIL